MNNQESSHLLVRERLIRSVINSTTGKTDMTRRDLSQISGISLTTVSKIVDKLVKEGLMTEQKKLSLDKRKGVSYLNWSNQRRVAVFDTCTREFSCTIFSLDMNIKAYIKYTYDDMISLEQNFRTFVFKCTPELSKKSVPDFCIVVTNDLDKTRTEIQNPFEIPPISHSYVSEALAKFFRPEQILSSSYLDTLAQSKIANILPRSSTLGIAYILVGKSISAAYISPDMAFSVCQTEKLPYIGGTLRKYISSNRNSIPIPDIAVYLCGICNAAYSPDIICLEFDDATMLQGCRHTIAQKLFEFQRELPEIYIQTSTTPLYIRGSALYARQSLTIASISEKAQN